MKTVVALLPYASYLALAAAALYCLLREQWVNRHLPKPVRDLLEDPAVHSLIQHVAAQTLLTDDEKRAQAEASLKVLLQTRGLAFADNWINLLIETAVRRLKADGAL